MKRHLIFALCLLMSPLAFGAAECSFDGKYVMVTPDGNMRAVTVIGDKVLLSVSDSQGQLITPVQVRRVKSFDPQYCQFITTIFGLDDGRVVGFEGHGYRIEGNTLNGMGQGMYTRENAARDNDRVIRLNPQNGCGPHAHVEAHPKYGPLCIQDVGAWKKATTDTRESP